MGSKYEKTTLGPHENVVTKLNLIPGRNVLAYACQDSGTVGLVKLPLSGIGYTGIIAHAKICDMTLCDSVLVTAGDNTVSLWSFGGEEEEETKKAENESQVLQRFYDELEFDHDGFSDELKDFFCFARVRGDDTENVGKIRVSEIPNVCRGLGYYPTQFEIERMINECKDNVAITRADFVRLFVNHRVIVTRENVEKAFDIVRQQIGVTGKDVEEDDEEETKRSKCVHWSHVSKLLHESGETLDRNELNACLSALLGDPQGTPKSLTPESFVRDVLGFQ